MNAKHRQAFSVFHDVDEASLKAWHRPYALLFENTKRVIDVGSGLMYFAELLRDFGVDTIGVDIDPAMVQVGREKGFEVMLGDQHALKNQKLLVDGVHISHVVEHLDGEDLIDLLRTSIACLSPGGLLVIRTPNWGNRFVREYLFWMDHTHKRPYPRQLLVKILIDLGMTIVESGDEPHGVNDSFVVAQLPGNASFTVRSLQFPPMPRRTLAVKVTDRIRVFLRRFLDLQ